MCKTFQEHFQFEYTYIYSILLLYRFKGTIFILNLKKTYLRKSKELKNSNKLGTSSDAVTKAEKAFRSYVFFSWLDEFTQVREEWSNLPSRKINTQFVEDAQEELEKKKENADDDSIQIEYFTLAGVFTIYQKLKKLKKIRQKTAKTESCYRLS